MYTRFGRDKGFTIVEILVVVGIIAVLIAILLPALSGAKKRSLKLKEQHAIRQVGIAWDLYANSNGGAVLPGFLEPGVQQSWKVTYEYPDGNDIPPAPGPSGGPPAPGYSGSVPNIAGPWTWRLLPYMDNNHEMVHGHLDEPEAHLLNMVNEAEQIAFEPAFGYNAYYVGGWWEMTPLPGSNENQVPRYRFFDATADLNGDGSIDDDESAAVVVGSIARMRRSSELVIFCSAALRQPGRYHEVRPDMPGSHFVVPPLLASEQQWGLVPGAQSHQEILVVAGAPDDPIPVPIGRYTDSAAVLYGDGHTASPLPGSLVDQRFWIDTANSQDYTHE